MEGKIQKLKQIVEKGLYADSLRDAIQLIDSIGGRGSFRLPLFVLRAIFASLLEEWIDDQGIESKEFERLNSLYQPPSLNILDSIINGKNQDALDQCENLASVFFDNP